MTACDSTEKAVFYTYAHYREDAIERGPFYIGKGRGRRAFKQGVGRSLHWQRVVAKHGLVVEILATWPTEAAALDHEVFLIGCFRSLGAKLVNLTEGGEGLSKPDPEVRARIGAAVRAQWENPVSRDKLIAARSTEDVVKRKSAALKIAFSKPGSKERRIESLKKTKNSPEAKARSKAMFESQEYRKKLSVALTAACARPEVKAQKSAAAKARWESQEYRAAFSQRIRRQAEESWAELPEAERNTRRRRADFTNNIRAGATPMTKVEASSLAKEARRKSTEARRALLPAEERLRLEVQAANKMAWKAKKKNLENVGA